MHPNPAFRGTPRDRNIAFARARGFGTLCVNAKNGPLLSHVPFLISDDAATVDLHLVRSNPICRSMSSKAAIAVNGPDAYVSPEWYETEDQVPTWNYVAVHLRGSLRLLPDTELRGILERLSDAMEARLAPKPIWKIDKVSDAALTKMLRQIVPIAMNVESVDGTWKLAQNKPDKARLAAADAMAETGFGSEYGTIAKLMKNPPA